jgi:hypothetical protein
MKDLLHTAISQVNIANPERCQLLGPQAQPVGQGDDGFIPLSMARGTGYLQQTPDLRPIQNSSLSTITSATRHVAIF